MDPWMQPPTQAVAQQYHDAAAQSQTTVDPLVEENDELLLDALNAMDYTLTGPGLDNALAASQPRQLNEGEDEIFLQYAPPPQPSTLQLNDARFPHSSQQPQSFAPELTSDSLQLPDESLQLNEYEALAHFPDALQFQPSTTACNALQPLQLVDQSQPLPSQALGQPLPRMNGTDFQLNTTPDYHASTNQPCYDTSTMHTNMLSHGHDQTWGDFNTTSNPDAISQEIPYSNDVGLPYDLMSGVWPTHTLILAASDLPLLADFPQPQNYSNLLCDNLQDGSGYQPTQSQASTVQAMYGPSSQDVYGRWPQTSNQTSQYSSQELISSPHFAEPASDQFASQSIRSRLIGSDSVTSFPNGTLQDVSHNAVTVMPSQAGSASEYPTIHAPPSSHAPNPRGPIAATPASNCVGLWTPLESRKAICGGTQEAVNTLLVPEVQQKSLSTAIKRWCPYSGSISKDGKPRAEKRIKNNYGRVKSACYLCKINKRTCDGLNKTLCSRCELYLRNLYGSQFQVQKFTCDVRTKFGDLDLIPCGSIIEELDEKSRETLHSIMVLRDGDEVQRFFTKLKPVIDFLDCLDPEHKRQDLLAGPHDITSYFSYMQSIVRWRDLFIEFLPDLKPIILTVVAIHSERLHLQLNWFDVVLVPKQDKEIAFYLYAMMYKETTVMRLCNNANKAAVEHFQSALEHRLIFTMADIFGAQSTKDLPEEQLLNRAEFFRLVSGAPFLLPPQYREVLRSLRESWPGFDDHYECPQEPHQSGREIDKQCICSPIMHCLPSHALICLGFDLSAFARDLHNSRDLQYLDLAQVLRHNFGSSDWPIFRTLFRLNLANILKATLDELTAQDLFVSKPNTCPALSLKFCFQTVGPLFLTRLLLSPRDISGAVSQCGNRVNMLDFLVEQLHVEGEKAGAYKKLRDKLRKDVRVLREYRDEERKEHEFCGGNCGFAIELEYE